MIKHRQNFNGSPSLFLYAISLALALMAAAPSSSLASNRFRERTGDAPGFPGIDHHWSPARKEAIGTPPSSGPIRSPIWFTVAEGILTEVFYPTADQAHLGDLQFLVADGRGYFSEQKRDTLTQVRYLDQGMAVEIVGTDRKSKYRYQQILIADPQAPTIRIFTKFELLEPGLHVYLLVNPAIKNDGRDNYGLATEDALYATRRSQVSSDTVFMALKTSVPFLRSSVGYVGFSDGWQDISKNFKLVGNYSQAGPGNIALTAEIAVPHTQTFTFETVLSFGTTQAEAKQAADLSLQWPFDLAQKAYEQGWKAYAQSLTPLRGQDSLIRTAQILKMHEDKRNPGALVAALNKPGIPYRSLADNANSGGYHLIWPRDLYKSAMGLLAAGDTHTPVDVLQYLSKTQREDGSWPQNFWINGAAYWDKLQMDEVAYPILLAYHLRKKIGFRLEANHLSMVRKAADFIVRQGPTSEQDRWEEIGGYIPGTLAAEIAALRAASQILNHPHYQRVAEGWSNEIERWTFLEDGTQGGSYYLRVSPSGEPRRDERILIANGGGTAFASEILDGGFLDLVRLGIRGPLDEPILATLDTFKRPTLGIASGVSMALSQRAYAFRRYNRDRYGAGNVGGYWPLLSGEYGHYAIAKRDFSLAQAQYQLMMAMADSNGHIPEQVIHPPMPRSVGMGVPQPLAWSHAELLLLARSLAEGAVFDAP